MSKIVIDVEDGKVTVTASGDVSIVSEPAAPEESAAEKTQETAEVVTENPPESTEKSAVEEAPPAETTAEAEPSAPAASSETGA